MYKTNQYIYTRERRHFGRHCIFSDHTQSMVNIQPSRSLRLNYILRNPTNVSTQLSDQKAFSVVMTENVTYSERGMAHCEGGWPKEINCNDEESTLRYRKKIEREGSWSIQVANLVEQTSKVIESNNTINIYEEFFNNLPDDLCVNIKDQFEARQKIIFHDPIVASPRAITLIDWSPNDINKFLALHRSIPIKAVDDNNSINYNHFNNFYIWDLQNPLRPVVTFECDEMVLQSFFCPKDENSLAGGLQSGKVCVWNARTGQMHIGICPLEYAHREAASAICWVHSKNNSEFYTGSCDGSIKYWNSRDLNAPLQEILLDPVMTDTQSRKRAHGVTVLEFEYTIPVRFIIGSDRGSVFVANRKGITPIEILGGRNYRLFNGPIKTIERNPFFVKNFLITGDWCAKIWTEECKNSPTTLLIKKKSQIMCGTWSTTRCSLFVTGDMGGELDFWDILLHQRNPIFSVKFSKPIMQAKFRDDGEYLAVGLDNGDVHVLELNKALKQSTSKDKTLVAAMLDREQLRSKLLLDRVEEMKLKQKTAVEEPTTTTLLQSPPQPIVDSIESSTTDEFLELISSDLEFIDVLNNFQDEILRVEKNRQDRHHTINITEFEIQQDITIS